MNQKLVNRKWDSLFATEKKSKVKNIEKINYYKEVWIITNSQPLETLNGIEKRGYYWHIDHIYPISLGFKNKIPPEKIGDISNLQILSRRDNFLKSAKFVDGK